MNREIKFRGLNANNEWVYGLPRLDLPNKTNYYNEFNYRMTWNENGAECNQPIKNGTLCQYTNLKDKNGVEIYEDDIVKCKLINQVRENNHWANEETYENYKVVYSNEDLGFRFKDEQEEIWKFENCELEVIGNIYENEVD